MRQRVVSGVSVPRGVLKSAVFLKVIMIVQYAHITYLAIRVSAPDQLYVSPLRVPRVVVSLSIIVFLEVAIIGEPVWPSGKAVGW